MDLQVKLYIERSQNELRLAQSIFEISQNNAIKLSLRLEESTTFFSAAISHSYYAIFYAAKAILLTKNIKTKSPDIHKKTLEEFDKAFIKTGELDKELLLIYKKLIIRAEALLEIFKQEKKKRGKFTYSTIAQANIEPAKDSINNAKKFISNVLQIIQKKR